MLTLRHRRAARMRPHQPALCRPAPAPPRKAEREFGSQVPKTRAGSPCAGL